MSNDNKELLLIILYSLLGFTMLYISLWIFY
jgi:hypothetical protein